MKDLIIKNVRDIKGDVINRDGNSFTIKQVVAGDDVDTCQIAFVEVPPGNYAYGYHYHDQREETFYVVSGSGTLRTYEGEKDVKAGDMLCFPTGEKGAHVLKNTSKSEPLVFIDFDVVTGKTDVVTFPDTKKMWVIGNHIRATVDMPDKE